MVASTHKVTVLWSVLHLNIGPWHKHNLHSSNILLKLLMLL